MSQKELDCRGLPCPQPVLQVKDALEQGAGYLEVLVDNEASSKNVQRLLRQTEPSVEMNRLGANPYHLSST